MIEPIRGKRYQFPLNNYDNRSKSGLFTGEYDKKNGNAILLTKSGERWSIPIHDLIPMSINGEKRKYIRKCSICGERHEQGEMIRDNGSDTGWICEDCHNELHPEYEECGEY